MGDRAAFGSICIFDALLEAGLVNLLLCCILRPRLPLPDVVVWLAFFGVRMVTEVDGGGIICAAV